uniref:Caspase 12/pseudo n=1 Tax=Microcebus murinus TaxID=30608 RepID=A0A8C5UM77_MICMU|nr:caspase-12-like isoform X2 [Microcebus murinus]
MAAKGPPKEDPVNKVKLMARNVLDGIFDDLMENRVLNRDELRKIGDGVNLIMNNAENLVEDITGKTQMAGKIFMERLFKPKQLSLTYPSESEDDESQENSASSSSSTESEEESEESRDEKKCTSAKAMAVSPTESRNEDEDEDEETEQSAGLAQASILALTAPQETQCVQHNKLKLCPRDHFHKLKTKKADEIYPVMEKEGRTRLALIICNKEFTHLPNRYGSEIDLLGMQDLLENLGYSVIVKENLTAQQMETELKEFAARQEHQSSDSTFLVFMSHGILDGICGTKHRVHEPDVLPDDTIFTIFNNRNCRSLKDKPKIIIMQACRGRGIGMVWVAADSGETTADTHGRLLQQRCVWNDAITKAHVEKDFIAFKSSTPHNISWRLDLNGSLFISQLIYYFKEYSWCNHLEEIFRKVQHSFETPNILTQMPTIERVSMTRYFYLFPGN